MTNAKFQKLSKAMRKKIVFIIIVIFLSSFLVYSQIPREKLLKRISIPSQKYLRGLVDLVGFAHTKEQIEYVVQVLEEVEKEKIIENQKKYNLSSDSYFIAGISPHDDYFYAGRGYIQIFRYIKAPTVIIFGVCHWAKTYRVENKFVFDAFKEWRGPYKNVPISSLREEIEKRLHKNDYIVNNEIHSVEHSIEALIPFLQYFNKNVKIVPILVPYMKWEKMDELAQKLSSAVAEIIKENNLKLGKDIAFLISTDCVHYGDYGWSYYHYFPFGCDAEGYKKGTEQDLNLIKNYLCGEVTLSKIKNFYCKCINPENPYQYRITWCGRFSVPMGLSFLAHLGQKLKEGPFYGIFLRYGTSLSFPAPPFKKVNLGPTYYSNLHHWVGFTSIGYIKK